jgi:hypothetical protein
MRILRLFEEFTYNDVGTAIVYHGSSDVQDKIDKTLKVK